MRRLGAALLMASAVLMIPYILMMRGGLSTIMVWVGTLLFAPGIWVGLLLGMHLEDMPLRVFTPIFSLAFWTAVVWAALRWRERRRVARAR